MTTTAESGSMGLDAPDTLLWAPEPHAAPAAALETACDSAVWTHARKGARIFWAGAEPLRLLAGTCAVGDALALAAPAVLLPPLLGTGGFDLRFEVVSATVLGVALTLEFLHLVGVYGHAAKERLPPQLARATAAWCLAFAILGALWWTATDADARLDRWLVAWGAAALPALWAVRGAAALRVAQWRRRGLAARIVAVVDAGGGGESLARKIAREGDARMVGLFAAGEDGGGLDALLGLARRLRIDDIFVTGSDQSRNAVGAALRKLATIPADVHICTAMPAGPYPLLEPRNVLGRPVLTVYRRPLTGWGRLAKRVEDVMLSALLLVPLAPLLLAIAALVALDSPGPVLFRQKRLGFNNNEFEMLKFRTMRHDPDGDRGDLQARRADPRVTRVGAVLRRTSLDELPQILNVLRGDMSLVGPRPHPIPLNDRFAPLIDGYLGRHRLAPGITGLAQMHGFRGETDTLEKMQKRIQYDLHYVENWSLLLDLRILLGTVAICIRGENAY